MKRREFIVGVGASAVLGGPWARGQQTDRVRHVGVLMHTTPNEPASTERITALIEELQRAGWSVGHNLHIETRWSSGDAARLRTGAADLVAQHPDVVVAGVGPTVQALQNASRSVPIVMAQSLDPVGAGLVAKLSRPGGNTTGFTQFEYGLSGKWLDLLLELTPSIKRVGVVRDQDVGTVAVAGTAQWAVIQAFASPHGIELTPINLSSGDQTPRQIGIFTAEGDCGLIVAVGALSTIQHALIVSTAAEYHVPAVYPYRFFVDAGGLLSYGPNLVALYRQAATYVDRILRGEKPADLPVQAPTKYELVINLKTAKALGLTIPPTLLARADEVIE